MAGSVSLAGCRIKRCGACALVGSQQLAVKATPSRAVAMRFARSITFPAEIWLCVEPFTRALESLENHRDSISSQNDPATMGSESVRRIEPIATVDLGIRSLSKLRTVITNLHPLQPSSLDGRNCYRGDWSVKHLRKMHAMRGHRASDQDDVRLW